MLAGQGPLRDLPGPAREHLENLTMAFLDHGIGNVDQPAE